MEEDKADKAEKAKGAIFRFESRLNSSTMMNMIMHLLPLMKTVWYDDNSMIERAYSYRVIQEEKGVE